MIVSSILTRGMKYLIFVTGNEAKYDVEFRHLAHNASRSGESGELKWLNVNGAFDIRFPGSRRFTRYVWNTV